MALFPLTPAKNHPVKSPSENAEAQLVNNEQLCSPSIVTEPPTSPLCWSLSNLDWSEASNEAVVRRHSLSLQNRTPPKNSIAADISERSISKSASNIHLLSKPTSAIWNSIMDIKEALSDFNTANSSLSLSSSEEDQSEGSGKKSKKKRKKKAKNEYSRQNFAKKVNNQASPK